MRIRGGALLGWVAGIVLLAAGCGSSHSSSGTSSVPLTLGQVKANLIGAGYKVTVYGKNEGALQIDATHKADGGLSIDRGPDGAQLYASVYEARDPAVRAVIVSRNGDESTPFVRGDLVFTISGTEPELRTIVRAAGDAGPAAGASTTSSPGTETVKGAMQRFIDAYAAGNEAAVCQSLTPTVLAKSQTFCDPNSIFYKRKPDPRVRQYSIASVTTSGDTATVVVTFAGVTEQVAMRLVGGRWKVDTELGAGRLF